MTFHLVVCDGPVSLPTLATPRFCKCCLPKEGCGRLRNPALDTKCPAIIPAQTDPDESHHVVHDPRVKFLRNRTLEICQVNEGYYNLYTKGGT